MEIYHNTTNESKENVKTYRKINKKQDTKVLEIIKNINKPFSPSLVWKKYIHRFIFEPAPLTSIRRSINTLENSGYFTKTGNKLKGMYKRNVNEYRLIKK